MTDRLAERLAIERWLEGLVLTAGDPVTTAVRLELLVDVQSGKHASAVDGDATDELCDVVHYTHLQALSAGGLSTERGRELLALGDAARAGVYRER